MNETGVCESCGAPARPDDRRVLDEFLVTAIDIQRFQVANRLGIADDAVDEAVLCADCAAAATQWANVD